MFFNGILLSLLLSNALCLSPISDSYNIRITRQVQERECGVIPKIKHRKDFNGLLSQFGQSPWQASLFDSKDGSFFCSGTLISSRHVVTSAACLLAINSPSSLEVRLGDWDISTQDSPYETYDHFSTSVNKVVISPDFAIVASWNQKSAVAVLKLDNEVDYVRYPHIAPLCLPPPLPQHHNHKSKRQFYDQCLATGWGAENYLIASGRKQNEGVTFVEPPKNLEPEDIAYLKPVIITKPSSFSMSKTVTVNTNPKIDNYEPTIIVPNLFQSISVSKEMEIPEVFDPAKATNLETEGRTNQFGVLPSDTLKNIDPVEEYIDLPEYLDEDGGDSKYIETGSDENLPVAATTYQRVSLSNMPRGEESMEVMESQTHQVVVPFNNFPAYPNNMRLNRSEVPEPQKAQLVPEHESRIYRHKQKYKQGRMASTHKRRNGKHDDHLKSHSVEKRSTRNGAFRVHRRKSLSNDLNINTNIQMNASTVLKSVQVIFRKKCRHMRTNLPEIISISNYNRDLVNLNTSSSKACIRPVKENEIPNFCMLDIGSPIVCTSVMESPDSVASGNLRQRRLRRNANKIFKTMHHISRHVFPTFQKVKLPETLKIRVPEKKKYMPTEEKMFLTGVITWKKPCGDEEDSNFNFRDTEVVSIQEILPFILESMQK